MLMDQAMMVAGTITLWMEKVYILMQLALPGKVFSLKVNMIPKFKRNFKLKKLLKTKSINLRKKQKVISNNSKILLQTVIKSHLKKILHISLVLATTVLIM